MNRHKIGKTEDKVKTRVIQENRERITVIHRIPMYCYVYDYDVCTLPRMYVLQCMHCYYPIHEGEQEGEKEKKQIVILPCGRSARRLSPTLAFSDIECNCGYTCTNIGSLVFV